MSRNDYAIWAAFLWPGGHHQGAWRLPYSVGDDLHSVEKYKRMAQAGRASQARRHLPRRHARDLGPPVGAAGPHRHGRATRANNPGGGDLAGDRGKSGSSRRRPRASPSRSTSLAKFGSLDHISGGRIGWNVVTTYTDDSGKNFGMDKLPPRAERYERAQEFLDVVKGLWDSYEDDAVMRDKASGQFFDPAKLHRIDHTGDHFQGPRAAQHGAPRHRGYPVICQSGASARGDGVRRP